jgi:hypothetical protein
MDGKARKHGCDRLIVAGSNCGVGSCGRSYRCFIAHIAGHACLKSAGTTTPTDRAPSGQGAVSRMRLLCDCPASKSLPIIGICVKPQGEKYFAFPEDQIRTISIPIPSHSEGVGHRRNEGRGCGGRGSCDRRSQLTRTAKACGPDVAVLASIHSEATVSRGATEAKEPFSGEQLC